MENASKALIIAGAILIAILLIGLGVTVMRNAAAPIDQAADISKGQTIEMFNSKFTSYSGMQSASAVKALITAIQSSNGINASLQIVSSGSQIPNGTTISSFPAMQAKVNNQKQYEVTFTTATTDGATFKKGYIRLVKIIEQP